MYRTVVCSEGSWGRTASGCLLPYCILQEGELEGGENWGSRDQLEERAKVGDWHIAHEMHAI
jgi:hypothetical protein